MAKPDIVGLMEHITPQLDALKIEIVMTTSPFCGDGDSIGYWDFHENRIEISIENPELWPMILAHEYGHVLQTLSGRFLDESQWDVFSKWLETQKGEARALKRAVRYIQACELDAEKVALQLVRSYSLCEAEEHIRQANDYIFKHEFARRHGFWPRGAGAPAMTPKKLVTAAWFAKVPRDSELLWLDRGSSKDNS